MPHEVNGVGCGNAHQIGYQLADNATPHTYC